MIQTTHYVRDAAGSVMGIYSDNILVELPVYGSSRLGIYFKQSDASVYQLTDHLGNVRVLVSDGGLSGATDYYPFGSPMPGRNLQDVQGYRYAYQGQEKDPETAKEAFEARLWDSRIGRWLTVDPAKQYANPYLGMGNNPITGIDPDGRKKVYYDKNGNITNTTHDNWFHNFFFGTKNFLSYNDQNYKLSDQGLNLLTSDSFEGIVSDFLTRQDELGFETRLEDAVSGYDPMKEDILSYVFRESNYGGNLDQKLELNDNFLYIVTNHAINSNEAGNIIWGAAMNIFGMDQFGSFASNYGGTAILNYKKGEPILKFDKYEHFEAQAVVWGNIHMGATSHGRQIRDRLFKKVYSDWIFKNYGVKLR